MINEQTKGQTIDYQETKKHGSTLFPFNIYPCTIPHDFPSVALHWQKSMELVYIKKGRGIVQLDMDFLDAQKGDIFVIPPGTLHALHEYKGDFMEYENIIFDLEFLGSTAADVCAQEYLIPLSAGQLLAPIRLRRELDADDQIQSTNSSYEAIYNEMIHCLTLAERLCETRLRGYELGAKGAILEFLALLIPLCPEHPRQETFNTERLKLVISKVEQDYTRPLTIQEMADTCGCSCSHFMRWFHQMTSTSFGHYVTERRLAFAAEQLRQSDDKVILIAQKSGFDNLSNFNRQFKARYGITPSEYRRQG